MFTYKYTIGKANLIYTQYTIRMAITTSNNKIKFTYKSIDNVVDYYDRGAGLSCSTTITITCYLQDQNVLEHGIHNLYDRQYDSKRSNLWPTSTPSNVIGVIPRIFGWSITIQLCFRASLSTGLMVFFLHPNTFRPSIPLGELAGDLSGFKTKRDPSGGTILRVNIYQRVPTWVVWPSNNQISLRLKRLRFTLLRAKKWLWR